MGLDSFWELPKGNQKIEFDPPLRLCGGMLSGHGEGSFRGKVYDTLVETITGQSLYQELISPEAVKKMSQSISATEFDSLPESMRTTQDDPSDYAVTRSEYEDLRRMFSAYAEAGACLKGWW